LQLAYFFIFTIQDSAMKNLFLIPVISVTIAACNNSSDKPVPDDGSVSAPELRTSWQATMNDSTGKLEMVSANTGPDTLTPAAVIAYLNSINANVQLQEIRTSNDTLYVKIPQAMYLTQQMGSSGPVLFFAEAVYNLTEIPGIRYVNFDFEEGDHASPSTISRETLRNE
jgi:hypothetical protein